MKESLATTAWLVDHVRQGGCKSPFAKRRLPPCEASPPTTLG